MKTNDYIYFALVQIILYSLFLFLKSYMNKKGKNMADIEDLPLITKIVESIKAKLNKEALLDLEIFKNISGASFKKIDIEKEIHLSAYKLTIERLVGLDKLISECFWMYLDKPRTRAATPDEWKKLLELRRYIFDSTMYLDRTIISLALDISSAYDTLMRLIGSDVDRDQYYANLSMSISEKYDTFKGVSKNRYYFDAVNSVVKSTSELIDYYKNNQATS
ncbi:hypothetical protein EHQ81_12000 [Leptospira selangorensis]|uniref:Uncharacterized protein n=1 Tax=Leptospira selangorensis TaxID=2484982 RepID=A0A5F2C2K5_9LEPT|nr:hypothetical protein [Leptospira selangorensis]TGM13036.1 hypothetical protein EHQ81_12000 [Leptospira selangorensis]TGM21811.1 hypothetical protein EHQ82_08245 [Leptospira selangorensis]